LGGGKKKGSVGVAGIVQAAWRVAGMSCGWGRGRNQNKKKQKHTQSLEQNPAICAQRPPGATGWNGLKKELRAQKRGGKTQ